MFENTRINEAMLGEHAPRQSAIAKEAEISQALTVNAAYIDNLNRAWEYHQNLKLKMIPYFYDEHEVIEVMDDESGDLQMLEVNAPAGYDAAGNVISVTNDLSAHRYRWKINPVDDSAVAKVRSQEEALIFINGAAGPLLQADPSGVMFAEFLTSSSNTTLQKVGKKMVESAHQASQSAQAAEQHSEAIKNTLALAKAKAELLRAEKAGVILNYRAMDMQDAPQLYELYIQLQQIFSANAENKMAEIQQLTLPSSQPEIPLEPGNSQGAAPGMEEYGESGQYY